MMEASRNTREGIVLPGGWYRDLLIYDIGMNTGQDTEFYLKKGFKVIAIEANPLLCKQAESKFAAYLKSGKLKILNVGIAKQNDLMDFFINEQHSEWSSFHKNIAGRDGSELTEMRIQAVTMEEVIATEGVPYYLKIDIEGNDNCALQSALGVERQIPYISVENGSTMLPMLHDGGYSRFKYIQQNNIHEQAQADPVLEGMPAEHQFEFGSSGKFGEETDGDWMTYDEIYAVVNRTWNVETGAKSPGWDDGVDGWFDLHARHANYVEAIQQLLNQT
jgi:FkbM family methyltransferase